MDNVLKFKISEDYKGTGVSQGLDRGLLAYQNDILLIEEGMGLGACAVQAGGFTYFTTKVSIKEEAEGCYEAVYSIDKMLEWKIFGVKSTLLTRMLEYICTSIYMKHEKTQKNIFKLGVLMQKLFQVRVLFSKVPPQGEIRVKYEVLGNEVFIDLCCKTEKNDCILFVMNELGGNLFDQGIINGEVSEPPSGWQKIQGKCELYSHKHMMAFTISEWHVPDNVRSKLYWGRELSPNHCWAGFESELKLDSSELDHYSYSVKFREVVE